MSTYYAPLNKIRAGDLFDGRLEKFGVREHITTDSTETSKCLTDGRNYLWVFVNDAGFVANINRYGGNAPSKILNAIAEVFAGRRLRGADTGSSSCNQSVAMLIDGYDDGYGRPTHRHCRLAF